LAAAERYNSKIGFSFKSLIETTLMGCLTMVKFNLSVGMRNEELLKELKGKISGESRQQVQEYLSLEPEGLLNPSYLLIKYPNKHCPLLFKEKNVTINNHGKYDRDILKVVAIHNQQTNQYAIIKKTYYDVELCYHCKTHYRIAEIKRPYRQPIYFLCGINDDDQLYFLHPLYEIPDRLIQGAEVNGNIKGVLEWANRVNEGYEGRLQGDIIYQFSKIEEHEHVDPYTPNLCFCKGRRYVTVKLNRMPQELIWVGLHLDSMETARLGYKGTLPSMFTQYVCLDDSTAKQQEDDKENRLFLSGSSITTKQLSIGNRHQLSTDGIIRRATGLRNTFIVIGQSLELTHPEHKSVVKQIPMGYAAILSIQRGSVNNGLDD
jgi:hypothetical protein